MVNINPINQNQQRKVYQHLVVGMIGRIGNHHLLVQKLIRKNMFSLLSIGIMINQKHLLNIMLLSKHINQILIQQEKNLRDITRQLNTMEKKQHIILQKVDLIKINRLKFHGNHIH